MQFMVQHRWTGFYLLITALGALMLFLYGFFPIKYHTGQIAHWNNLPTFIDGVSIDGQEVFNPGETSVVLMVIDGLRYDFVTEEYMPYTGQLLKNKTACIYVSIAEPPTVTMPRIKAMMTGSVSTFADVALNFGAPAVLGDSVLRVAAARGRRSVMYGDDTWLRLFPGLWTESDGTTSFFVTDYTEVDDNVTRHLDTVLEPDEKKKPSFDFLVLHYLGLDHIGHLEGAKSPKIKPKLKEMDDVVKKIFTAMQKWDHNGVLLICGDHGMRDAGGHGGATPSEVLVPLVVVRSDDFECPHPLGPGPIVAQVDLAPSISWLLRAPFPGDSTGRVLPALMPTDVLQELYLLHYTSVQNSRAIKANLGADALEKEFYKQFQRAEKNFARYITTNQKSAAKMAKEYYEQSLAEMSKYLTESTVEFDMFAIIVGISLLAVITTALFSITLYSLQGDEKRRYSVTAHGRHRSQAGAIVAFAFIVMCFAAVLTLSCAIAETKSSLCSLNPQWMSAFASIAVTFSITFFIIKTTTEANLDLSILEELNAIDYLLIGGTIFHSVTFFGTSFIEEEHMTWYFFWNTLMFFVLVRTLIVLITYLSKSRENATEIQEKPQLQQKMSEVGIGMLPKWVILIALHRYLRTMNQTGDRWAFLPDTADWLNEQENSLYLQALMMTGTFATFLICVWNIRYTNNFCQMNNAITIVAVACIVFYRIATNALDTPIEIMKTWDSVHIVNVFWVLLIAQMIFELLTFIGIFRKCRGKIKYGNPDCQPVENNAFVYNKPKAKTEDYVFTEYNEPWNGDEVKLRLIRSVSHLVLNDMMLIIILLMRPHNVIMVPSCYITCVLTSKCMDHSLLDRRPGRRTDILDVLSQSLVHFWIGYLFFFYQGNSNSLSSVDLGAGYVGLREYCPVRVSMRMGIHTYAGPALAGMTLFCSIAARAKDLQHYFQSAWRCTNVLALLRAYGLLVYTIVAAIFRHHLFVWTVFSPKLLYDFVATIFSIAALATIAEIIFITYVVNKIARILTFKSL